MSTMNGMPWLKFASIGALAVTAGAVACSSSSSPAPVTPAEDGRQQLQWRIELQERIDLLRLVERKLQLWIVERQLEWVIPAAPTRERLRPMAASPRAAKAGAASRSPS